MVSRFERVTENWLPLSTGLTEHSLQVTRLGFPFPTCLRKFPGHWVPKTTASGRFPRDLWVAGFSFPVPRSLSYDSWVWVGHWTQFSNPMGLTVGSWMTVGLWTQTPSLQTSELVPKCGWVPGYRFPIPMVLTEGSQMTLDHWVWRTPKLHRP